jgi:hypothetical protein
MGLRSNEAAAGRGPSPVVKVQIGVNASFTIKSSSIDPKTAAENVMSVMPQIERGITTALVRSTNQQLVDAVKTASRR